MENNWWDLETDWWDNLTPEEQYNLYLEECEEYHAPAMTFEEWSRN